MKRLSARQSNENLPKCQSGRLPGAKNINQNTLFNLVFKHKPFNSEMWDVVAQIYISRLANWISAHIWKSSGIKSAWKSILFTTMVMTMMNGKKEEEKMPSSQEIQEYIEYSELCRKLCLPIFGNFWKFFIISSFMTECRASPPKSTKIWILC